MDVPDYVIADAIKFLISLAENVDGIQRHETLLTGLIYSSALRPYEIMSEFPHESGSDFRDTYHGKE